MSKGQLLNILKIEGTAGSANVIVIVERSIGYHSKWWEGPSLPNPMPQLNADI